MDCPVPEYISVHHMVSRIPELRTLKIFCLHDVIFLLIKDKKDQFRLIQKFVKIRNFAFEKFVKPCREQLVDVTIKSKQFKLGQQQLHLK